MSDSNEKQFEKGMGFLRNVIPLLNKYRLTPNVINYSVFYEYVSGENKDISEFIEEAINNDSEISEIVCKDLFSRYILVPTEQELVSANLDIQKIMQEVQNIIKNAGGNASAFEANLSEKEQQMSEISPDVDTVQSMLKELKENTINMRHQSESLKEELTVQLNEADLLRNKLDHVKKEANIDFLTKVANRQALDRFLSGATQNSDNMFSFAMIDIDFFKKFNDTHGHLVGDQVLRLVANQLKNDTKGQDLVARFGGEEFAILLPETTLNGAKAASQNICDSVRKMKLVNKKSKQNLGNISVSIGIAEFKKGDTPESIIARADKALYQAKESGRDQVCIAS